MSSLKSQETNWHDKNVKLYLTGYKLKETHYGMK